jgi:small conductance mechanosensitive channel
MLEDKAHNLVTELGGLLPLIVSNTLNALGAILILLIGLWLSGKADLLVGRMFSRTPHFDPMLQSFFAASPVTRS